MKAEAAERAAGLVAAHRVAALGTLHDGMPSVSMAPFAFTTAPFALVVLVSTLSAHTRDMAADPRVALLITEPESPGQPVHALARVSIQATARSLAGSDQDYGPARAAYESRFPEMAALFSLGDFGLFRLEPTAVRVVSGFAQAASIAPESLGAALRAASGASG